MAEIYSPLVPWFILLGKHVLTSDNGYRNSVIEYFYSKEDEISEKARVDSSKVIVGSFKINDETAKKLDVFFTNTLKTIVSNQKFKSALTAIILQNTATFPRTVVKERVTPNARDERKKWDEVANLFAEVTLIDSLRRVLPTINPNATEAESHFLGVIWPNIRKELWLSLGMVSKGYLKMMEKAELYSFKKTAEYTPLDLNQNQTQSTSARGGKAQRGRGTK